MEDAHAQDWGPQDPGGGRAGRARDRADRVRRHDSSSPPARRTRASRRPRPPEVTRPSSSGPTTRPTPPRRSSRCASSGPRRTASPARSRSSTAVADLHGRADQGLPVRRRAGHLRGRRTTRSAPWSRTASWPRSTCPRTRTSSPGGGHRGHPQRQHLRRAVGGGEHRAVRQQEDRRPSARPPSTTRSPTPRSSSGPARSRRASASPCRSATGGDFYHWYPLFTADGGYVFGGTPTAPTTPTTWASDNDGARHGRRDDCSSWSTRASSSRSVTYDIARETFQDGKSPYLITGPWQIPGRAEGAG